MFDEKQKLIEIINEMENRKRTEPLHIFKPFNYQIDFWNSTKPVQVIKGGNATGKSTIAALKVAHFVLGRKKDKETKIFWIITKSYDMHTVTWQEKLSKFINPREIESINWNNRTKQIPNSVLLKNNILLEFKSWESGAEALTGRSIIGAWFDEPFPEDIFIEVFARTRDEENAPIICSQTPINHDPFLIGKWQNRDKDWDWFNWHTIDNKALPEGFFEKFAAQIPDDMKDTRLRGEFGSYEGQVYKEFSRNTHVMKYDDIIARINRDHNPIIFRSIDLGFSHPFVCLWIYKDGDGCYYCFDEHYKNQTTLDEHVKAINQRPYNIYKTLCDPEDAQVRAELSKLGLPTLEAKKAVFAGIESVKQQLVLKANGKPNLYFSDFCKNTIREMEMYRWADGLRDKPLKEHDHCCFTADTKIDVPHGEIINIQSQGIKKVYYFMGSWVTGDHPYLTNNGWCRLDSLRYDTIIYIWKKTKILSWNVSLLTGLSGGGIQMPSNPTIETIFNLIQRQLQSILKAMGQNICINGFGLNTMGLYLRDIKSIIWTAISLIMTLIISNVLHLNNIMLNIMNKIYQYGKKILKKPIVPLANGIVAQQVSQNIKKLVLLPLKMLNIKNIIVNIVKKNIKVKPQTKHQNIVLMAASNQHLDYDDKTQTNKNGLNKIKLICQKWLKNVYIVLKNMNVFHKTVNSVQVNVIENGEKIIDNLPTKYDEVFAIATSCGWFTANDVIVSNCDPLRYAIFYDNQYKKTDWAQLANEFRVIKSNTGKFDAFQMNVKKI